MYGLVLGLHPLLIKQMQFNTNVTIICNAQYWFLIRINKSKYY